MDDELDVAIGPFHFPGSKPCITAVLSLHASSRSACRRFQRGHNTSAGQFVARRMCRSLGVSGLGRHAESDTASRGRVCTRSGLCGQRPGMGIACTTTCHRRRIAISLNPRRTAAEYIGYSRPRFSRYLLSRVAAPFVFALNAAGFLLVFLAIPALPKKGCDSGRTLLSFVRSISTSVRYVAAIQKCTKHPFSERESSVPLSL